MKTELENKLVKKYPKFFEHLKNYKGPVLPIQFGFECSDGWYVLIDSLMGCIHNYIENMEKYPNMQIKSKFWRIIFSKLTRWFRYHRNISKLLNKIEKRFKKEAILPPPIQLMQLKEKFGGLRFYINGGDERIEGMISLAEDLSYKICEFCGSTENVGQTKGWITTMCKSCFDKGLTNIKDWTPNEI